MIEIATWSGSAGRDYAKHGNLTAGSANALARLLVADGVPDQPWRTVTRAGTVSLTGRSLFGLAQVVAVETDAGGLRWARHRPFPTNSVSSAVLRASGREGDGVAGVAVAAE